MKQFINVAAITLILAISLSVAQSQTVQNEDFKQNGVLVSPQMKQARLEYIRYKQLLDSCRSVAPTEQKKDIIQKLKEATNLSALKTTYFAQLSNKPKANRPIHFDERTLTFAW